MSDIVPHPMLEFLVLPMCENERKGYEVHFNKVYVPILQHFIQDHKKHFDVFQKACSAANVPMWRRLAMISPDLMDCLPYAVAEENLDKITSTIRLHRLADSDSLTWQEKEICQRLKAMCWGAWMYRCGWDRVEFNFHGGGDQGVVEDATAIRGRGDNAEEESEMQGISLHEWVYDLLPSFGDGDPYYEDGKGIIHLKNLRYKMSADVQYSLWSRKTTQGEVVRGVDMPSH